MNGTILGQVVTGPQARPVADATVMLYGPPPASAVLHVRSRADGAFSARRLTPGRWRVAVAGAAPVNVQVLDWAATPVVLELPHEHNAAQPPATRPEPAAVIEPWLEEDTATDGQDGDDGSVPDLYQLEPAATSCASTPRRGSGSVVGWVRDARSRQPAAGASISLHSSVGSAPDIAPFTNEQGRFALDGLSEGLWILRAHAQGGATGESVVAVRAGLVSQLVIDLDAPGGPDSLTGAL